MKSICFVGNYAPRCCGIATFTQDLRNSVLQARPGYTAQVVVVEGEDDEHVFPPEVQYSIGRGNRAAYMEIARKINESGVTAVSLQHEFGIYGGADGVWIVDLLRHLTAPVVTTCHTVLKNPSPSQKSIIQSIARYSEKIVVMAEKGADFLRDIYDIPDFKIDIVPHGIPDLAVTPEAIRELRKEVAWHDRPVLLTFGLLSPNKGVEHAIGALPGIVRDHPEVLYVIAGATHPNLVKQEGESYRQFLVNLAEELGVTHNISFIDRFIPEKELVSFIAAADLYLTPYLSEAQITSGTLAFAFGLGKPVISTPYWYAQELLADHAGVLVPFADSDAIAQAAGALLSDTTRRAAMAAAAQAKGEQMRWNCVGRKYAELLLKPLPTVQTKAPVPSSLPAPWPIHRITDSFHQLEQMTGTFGIYQHALLDRPDPRHGFCADDNARVVVLLSGIKAESDSIRSSIIDDLDRRCLNSLWDSYNPKLKRFRNFMDDEGRWLEERGSEDSHGRVLWAMGIHLAKLPAHERSLGRTMVFLEAILEAREFTSPRSWAFTLLGIGHFAPVDMARPVLREVQKDLSDRLIGLFRRNSGVGWHWFEDVATYDNAKLSEALLFTYLQTGNPACLEVGLSSLEFLLEKQRSARGHFRPVGCRGFWKKGSKPAHFDQQPLEAQAMTAACLKAAEITRLPHWISAAKHAYGWYMGANDHGLPMALPTTGGCYDGLMEEGVNENQGAESILAYLQSTFDLRKTGCAIPAWSDRPKSLPRHLAAYRDQILSA